MHSWSERFQKVLVTEPRALASLSLLQWAPVGPASLSRPPGVLTCERLECRASTHSPVRRPHSCTVLMPAPRSLPPLPAGGPGLLGPLPCGREVAPWPPCSQRFGAAHPRLLEVLPGSLGSGSESHHLALPTSSLPAQTLVPSEGSCFPVLGTAPVLGAPPGLSPGCPPSPPPSEPLLLHTSSTTRLCLPGVLLKDFGSLDVRLILGVHPWLSLVKGGRECPQEPSDGSLGSEGGDGSRNTPALSSFRFCGCSRGTRWLRGQVRGWQSF